MGVDRGKPAPASNETHADSVDSFLREAAAVSEPAASAGLPLLPLESGEIVGERFRIENCAGTGGMGAVYRATDLSTGLLAAVKVVGNLRRSIVDRFFREALVLAELSHPRIVRYVAHGMTPQGLPFLAMDWLDGEDLSVRLAGPAMETEESLSLVRLACEGLAAAHARGVVHRDVKPSNLFLVDRDPAGVKVIDFGVAHLEAGLGALTRPGTSLGTAGYMAPEQAIEAADVDARADVYALGCVLFECLTGRPPFVGRPAALLVRVLREPPPRLRELKPGLSEALDSLMCRLLAKNREERPSDAAELLRALDGLGTPT
jgi:serine/threonine protein kinase